MAKKVLSAIQSSGTHRGPEFLAGGPHVLFYERTAASTLTVEVQDPSGNWVSLHTVTSGSSDGRATVWFAVGHKHRVVTPNAGYQAEAWIAPAGENYVYTGGV